MTVIASILWSLPLLLAVPRAVTADSVMQSVSDPVVVIDKAASPQHGSGESRDKPPQDPPPPPVKPSLP